MRTPLRILFASLALSAASPSLAALTMVGTGCDETLPDPNADACAGAFAGNLNNNSSIGDLNAALDVLAGGNFQDAVWADLDPTKTFFSAGSGTTVNFWETLFGGQILSLHFGNAGSGLGNHTILYLFDFGLTGANSVMLNQQGWSNGVLVTPPGGTPPVPEPATWAMMLMGFGAAGYAIRRRRKTRLAQIA